MLRTAEQLRGLSLDSGGVKIGKLEDFYFDDRFWTIRYMVIDTGGWLVQRRTLISPRAVTQIDGINETISTDRPRTRSRRICSPRTL